MQPVQETPSAIRPYVERILNGESLGSVAERALGDGQDYGLLDISHWVDTARLEDIESGRSASIEDDWRQTLRVVETEFQENQRRIHRDEERARRQEWFRTR